MSDWWPCAASRFCLGREGATACVVDGGLGPIAAIDVVTFMWLDWLVSATGLRSAQITEPVSLNLRFVLAQPTQHDASRDPEGAAVRA